MVMVMMLAGGNLLRVLRQVDLEHYNDDEDDDDNDDDDNDAGWRKPSQG